MHTIEIPEANITRYIPSELSECTAQEYIDMCELIFEMICGQISFDELKIHAVYKLMKMKPAKEFLLPDDETQKYLNIAQVGDLIENFFEINPDGQKVIKQNYLHNPVPSFKPIYKKYYGPADQFTNITFGEYNDALRLFLQFNSSSDVELLYKIAAILYRPKKPFHFILSRLNNYDGDIRIDYNPSQIDNRAKALKYAPMGFIYGVYLLFASFQKIISTATLPWAGRNLDLSILFTPDANDVTIDIGKDDIGMDSIMFAMAESGVFGSPKELAKTNLWIVLVRMYDSRLNDLKQKKQEENAKSNTP
jgi:hypothetical protein